MEIEYKLVEWWNSLDYAWIELIRDLISSLFGTPESPGSGKHVWQKPRLKVEKENAALITG